MLSQLEPERHCGPGCTGVGGFSARGGSVRWDGLNAELRGLRGNPAGATSTCFSTIHSLAGRSTRTNTDTRT